MRLTCCCQSRHSDRESVSGSETGATEAVDHQRRGSRGSKRRQRATYRYEVVYRREEFSHDYLDHPPPPVQNHHPFRPPEGQPTADSQQPLADYSLLSNYGRLEDFHPPAVHCWEQQYRPPHYSDQPLYQNFGWFSH